MQAIPRTVSILMTPCPVVVDWRASLDEAYRLLQRFPFRHLPVVEGTSLVGVVSNQDLLQAAQVLEGESGRNRRCFREMVMSCPVGDLIRTPTPLVSPGDSQLRAVRLMLDHGIDALPVVSDGGLVGIVTSTDLLDSFVELCLEHGAACDSQVFRHVCRSVPTLPPDMEPRQAMARMDPEVGFALVQNGADVIGVVSSRELCLGLLSEMVATEEVSRRSKPLVLRDLVSVASHCVEPGSRLSRAALKMVADETGALPVTRMGRALGLIRRTEILRHYASCL